MDRHSPDDEDEFDDSGAGLEAFDFLYGDEPAESVGESLFTVTNPPRTVAVTAYLDGRTERVTLFPATTALTEIELAEEVVLIADLATREARSAQYESAFNTMRELGHDEVSTRDFLTRNLDLPSPPDALAHRTQVFATRYLGENDD